jgi:hypothetical protein
VGVTLRVTVILQIYQESALARIFCGVVFGMSHFPVGEFSILSPYLFRYRPPFQEIACPETKNGPQFTLFGGNPRKQLEEKRWVSLLIFVPRITLELFLSHLVLDKTLIVKFLEIAL